MVGSVQVVWFGVDVHSRLSHKPVVSKAAAKKPQEPKQHGPRLLKAEALLLQPTLQTPAPVFFWGGWGCPPLFLGWC